MSAAFADLNFQPIKKPSATVAALPVELVIRIMLHVPLPKKGKGTCLVRQGRPRQYLNRLEQPLGDFSNIRLTSRLLRDSAMMAHPALREHIASGLARKLIGLEIEEPEEAVAPIFAKAESLDLEDVFMGIRDGALLECRNILEKCLVLQHLNINQNRLSNSDFSSLLLPCLGNLRTLAVRENPCGDQVCKSIGAGFFPFLERIDVSDTEMSLDGASSLHIEEQRNLQSLWLYNNNISWAGVEATGLLQNKRFQHLNLANMGIVASAPGVQANIGRLSEMAIESLCLAANDFTGEDLSMLGLARNKSIKLLSLSYTFFLEKEGLEVLSRALTENKTLQALSLGHNELGGNLKHLHVDRTSALTKIGLFWTRPTDRPAAENLARRHPHLVVDLENESFYWFCSPWDSRFSRDP